MERERDVKRKLLQSCPDLAETSDCYVSMTLDVPFTDNHLHSNVFANLPYSWADVIKQEHCSLPYVVMKSQFKLVLMSIASLHKAGIAHSCIQPSAVRLSYGLIPHIVGFEHARMREHKRLKSDHFDSDGSCIPPSSILTKLKNGLKGYNFDQVRLLDLYAYAAMMLQAFFYVEYTKDRHIRDTKDNKPQVKNAYR